MVDGSFHRTVCLLAELMACKQCGDCCTYIALEISSDTALWLEMHGIPLITENGKRKLMIDAACRRQDPVTKLCLIYDERPTICKNYLCDVARGA